MVAVSVPTVLRGKLHDGFGSGSGSGSGYGYGYGYGS